MKKKLTYLFLVLIAIGFFNSGCVKNETCLSANNLLMASFYTVETDTTIIETTVDSLTLFFVGQEDSILYDNSKDVGAIDIPLSDTSKFLKVVAKINDAVDTLYIDYRPYSVFRSTECGVINRYEINEISFTNNKIQAIYLENKSVDETEAVNIYMLVDVEQSDN